MVTQVCNSSTGGWRQPSGQPRQQSELPVQQGPRLKAERKTAAIQKDSQHPLLAPHTLTYGHDIHTLSVQCTHAYTCTRTNTLIVMMMIMFLIPQELPLPHHPFLSTALRTKMCFFMCPSSIIWHSLLPDAPVFPCSQWGVGVSTVSRGIFFLVNPLCHPLSRVCIRVAVIWSTPRDETQVPAMASYFSRQLQIEL